MCIRDRLTVIPRAFRIAASGRPGPVLVDIPKDVQNQLVDVDEWPAPGCADVVPPPDGELIGRAAAMINAAAKPVLYLGGGVVHSGAAEAAVAPVSYTHLDVYKRQPQSGRQSRTGAVSRSGLPGMLRRLSVCHTVIDGAIAESARQRRRGVARRLRHWTVPVLSLIHI